LILNRGARLARQTTRSCGQNSMWRSSRSGPSAFVVPFGPVLTKTFGTPHFGLRASTRAVSHATVAATPFVSTCRAPDRAGPFVASQRTPGPSSAGSALHRHAGPWTTLWRSLASRSERRASPHGYARFLREQTLQLGSKAPYLGA